MTSPRPHPSLSPFSPGPRPRVKVGTFQYVQISSFSVFVSTWQSCLLLSIPQLIWNWEFYSLFTDNQGPILGGPGPKEMVPNDHFASAATRPNDRGWPDASASKKEVKRNFRGPAIKQLPTVMYLPGKHIKCQLPKLRGLHGNLRPYPVGTWRAAAPWL